jgi:integrase/recombinase XerD
MDSNASTTVKDGYGKFIRIKKAKNLSPHSIVHYELQYKLFGEFFGVTRPCSEITEDTYYEYIEHLKDTRNANTVTLNTYLGSLRTILYFFMEEGYMSKFKIMLLKAEKKIKETYADGELEKILKKPNIKKCSFTEYRNWVMANYFLGTGNRLSTAINLLISHLDFENNLIFMDKTKNGRQQLIPMSKSLGEILQEYLVYRKGEGIDYVFCDCRGRQLTKSGTTTIIRKYHLSRGVERTSTHAYRHTFAKKWILNGGDIFRLQKILGHSSVEMVKNYVEMFNNDLQQDFDTFNPLENFIKHKQGAHIKINNQRAR